MSAPVPDINEWQMAQYHADRARLLRGFARQLRAGSTIYGWRLGECERHARRHEEAVRDVAFHAERSFGYAGAARLRRASLTRQYLQNHGLPCSPELLPRQPAQTTHRRATP